MKYEEFLKTKKLENVKSGFIFDRNGLNKSLFDFQKDIVLWSLERGKAAIFADCGLGKTIMQLDWADIISKKFNEKVLIVTPLSVGRQTIKESVKFGIETNLIRTNGVKDGINIINYENLDKINPDDYIAVVLDESSILKNYTGKTKKMIIDMFKDTKYKLCCTATPSPNDHMEMLNHSEFLDKMKSNEALSCWFINDTMNTGKYRLKHHAEQDYWEWVSSWAVSISKPSDLGYDDGGFELPKKIEDLIEIKEIILPPGEGDLFYMPDINATSYHKIRRETIDYKAKEILQIIERDKTNQFAIWVGTNAESSHLTKLIDGAVEIKGSDSASKKEQAAIDFVDGKIKILITKSSIFGYGMNFQNCHNVIFCGLSYSYEDYYQTVRRFWRFGQKKPVTIYKIITSLESDIYRIVNEKALKHEKMKDAMKFYKELFNINNKREFKMNYNSQLKENETYKVINGDCVEEIKTIEDESLDMQIFSPPFSQLYIYSDSYRDMGNTKDDEEFFKGFDYLVPELLRTLKSGRLCVVHCKQLVNYKNRDGASGIRDFRGDIIRLFQKHGFVFHTEVCIWKDPVIEMQRTKSHGLLYKQLRKDSSYSRAGLPDYLVVFRKWSDLGDVSPVDWKTKDNFKLDKWQEYASPVWKTIQQTNVLNKKMARENSDEKHICPLQLDVIERCVEMWTNPEDVVFSPFSGIGSEGYQSILLGRKYIGIELKKSYYEQSIKYLDQAVEKVKEVNKSLFDVI